MKVLVINPNTTAAMTSMVTRRLRARMPSGTQFVEMTAATGHAVIATQQAFDDAALTAQAMLRDAIDRRHAFDAVLLACFGDPGLEGMQSMSPAPVTGLAQASVRAAERAAQNWAIVTAGPAWRDILMRRLDSWGASALFKGVHVLEGSGANILKDPAGMLPAVTSAVALARDSGAARVILGGAVFAGYAGLMAAHGLQVDGLVDCVDAAAATLTDLTPFSPAAACAP